LSEVDEDQWMKESSEPWYSAVRGVSAAPLTTNVRQWQNSILYSQILHLEEGITWTAGLFRSRLLTSSGNPENSQFGGICPVTRCAKRLLNGPCGGSSEDRCEVDSDKPCAWQLIYARLKAIGQLDRLEEIVMPKDWSTAWYGGARKIIRKDHQV